MDKNSDVFNKSIFKTDGKQNKKHFFAVRSMVVCFLALIIQMFCFMPALAVNEIKCCVGETISIRSSENETPRFDSDYLIRNKDKTFTAIKDGTTKVTFTSQAENTDNQGTGAFKERTVTVKISKQVKNISLNKAEITLGAGETLKLKYTLTKGTWCQSVKFISSKKNVASVDKNGKLTAKKAGTAVITAKTSNGLSAVCVVTVKNAPKTVKLNATKLILGVGESFNLNSSIGKNTASYLKTYTSSNSKIATVNKSGVVKALKTGNVTVTFKIFNGKTAKCVVNVKPAPKKITLSKTAITLGAGEKFTFSVKLPKNTASNKIIYLVSNGKIGTVSKKGVFTAKKPGAVKVTVKAFNGVKSICTVTVKNAPNKIKPSASTFTKTIGSKFKPKFTFNGNAFSSKQTLSSSDSSVVAITSDGYIWPKKIGSAKVTAKTFNGKKCSFKVTVKAMGVPFVSQLPKYPTGCEAAAATSLLRYYGYNVTLDRMIVAIPSQKVVTVGGKRYGPSIYEKFVGDPTKYYNSSSPGYGAFSPVIKKAVQKVINKVNGKHKAVLLTGCTFSELKKEIAQGHPAIVWSTYRMLVPKTVNSWYIKQSNGKAKYFEYPKGTHVTVLTGFSDSAVYMVDPIDGVVSYNINTFKDRWNLLGRQAIVLNRK